MVVYYKQSLSLFIILLRGVAWISSQAWAGARLTTLSSMNLGHTTSSFPSQFFHLLHGNGI